MARNDTKTIRCSFCGRPQNLAGRLIAGNGAYICDECVRTCMDIVAQADPRTSNQSSGPVDLSLEKLPKPAEIKEKLDYRESNTTDCWQLNLQEPTKPSENRDKFWRDYRKHGIEYVMDRYGVVPVWRKVGRKIKGLLK